MLEAVREFADVSGAMVGVKVAGGIRTTKDAIRYLVMVNEVAGEAWLEPGPFPHRCLEPAERPADAAFQAAPRRLRRLAGLQRRVARTPTVAMAAPRFSYAPAPESRADTCNLKPSYGLFINGEFVDPRRRRPLQDREPLFAGGAGRDQPGRAGRRRPGSAGGAACLRGGLGHRCPARNGPSTSSGWPA